MSDYPAGQTVKEALHNFFAANNLGEDGGLNKMWAKIKVGPVYIPILNPPARRKALVFHDIHHIVTGYKGDWKGEVSISAWELSSGCGKLIAAWVLDLMALAIGLVLYPSAVYHAFIRGQRTRNLYKNNITHEAAGAMRIDELRAKLSLDQPHSESPTSAEKTTFLFYCSLAFLAAIVPLAMGIALVYWLFFR
jgi:hypothetical protein